MKPISLQDDLSEQAITYRKYLSHAMKGHSEVSYAKGISRTASLHFSIIVILSDAPRLVVPLWEKQGAR